MKPGGRAFSLVEVVLALGILSFALLSILALVPAGAKISQVSTRETQAAFLLTVAEADLRNTHPSANQGKSKYFNLILPYSYDPAKGYVSNSQAHTNTFTVDYSVGLDEGGNPVPISTRPTPPLQLSVIYTRLPASTHSPSEARLIVNWPCVETTSITRLTSLTNGGGFVESFVAFPSP